MDHMGVTNGVILNGADDNASGTAVAMEVGRLLARHSFRRYSEPFRLLAEQEPNLTVFVNRHAFAAEMEDPGRIRSVQAVDTLTGAATSWDPGANGSISTLMVRDGVVYTGGYFTRLGGLVRKYIGAVEASTDRAQATRWGPASKLTVTTDVRLGATGCISREVYARVPFSARARSRAIPAP